MTSNDAGCVVGRINEPINLREQFGDQYRIAHDEAYEVEKPEFRRRDEIWLQQIPCKYGHICLHSGRTLGAWSDSRSRRKMLTQLPGCTVHVEGDHEVSVLFDVSDFDAVAGILEPRRRRRLSVAQRQECIQRLSAWRSAAKIPHARAEMRC